MPKVSDWLREHIGYSGDGCLTWPFARDVYGYGLFGYEGKVQAAHRIMCKLVHGEPPTPDHVASHDCGNGHLGCVHPKHLLWKTRSEDCVDRARHGRFKMPSNGAPKLSPAQIIEIKELHETVKLYKLAEKYGVSRQTIRKAIARHPDCGMPIRLNEEAREEFPNYRNRIGVFMGISARGFVQVRWLETDGSLSKGASKWHPDMIEPALIEEGG